jgi:gliding motility-associated-like protein
MLNAANTGAEYLWNTGDETASITVDTAGFYRVTVRKGSCRESDSLRISEVLMPRVDLGPDTTICLGQAYTLDAEAPDVKDYLWADGSNLPVHAVSAAGTYAVTLSNSCGIASDVVRIRTENCANELVFPTAFTPNHDGRNDLFRPRIFLQISHYSLSVFDRWGRKVFQGTDAEGGWDGTEDGSIAPVGTYLWTAHYIIGSAHTATAQKGTVTLLR